MKNLWTWLAYLTILWPIVNSQSPKKSTTSSTVFGCVPPLGDSRQLRQFNEPLVVNASRELLLQEVIQNLNSGESVFINIGFVNLTQTLTITGNNVIVRGRGQNETVLHCSEETRSALILRGYDIRIEGLTITGCARDSAVLVDGRNGTGRTGVSVYFLDVGFTHNGRTGSVVRGAGIRIEACLEEDCTRPEVNITRCTFANNAAVIGGSVYGTNCALRITGSSFVSNTALYSGGAVFLDGRGPVLELQSCTFTANRAANMSISASSSLFEDSSAHLDAATVRGGGAMFLGTASRLTVIDSNFSENTADLAGGAIRLEIEDLNDQAESTVIVSFEDNLFYKNSISCLEISENSVDPTHPELFSMGGALFVRSPSTTALNMTVLNSTFEQNSARGGGALYIQSSLRSIHHIKSCVFTGNEACGLGGAILVAAGLLKINGSSFVRNTARTGGGIFVLPNSNVIAGPDIATGNLTVFEHNIALNGGAIQAFLEATLHFERVVFRHNRALRYGGALRAFSTLLLVSLLGVLFENNTALVGGAISAHSVLALTLDEYNGVPTKIINNTAVLGGGLYRQRGRIVYEQMHIRNTEFRGNRAVSFGDPSVDWFNRRVSQESLYSSVIEEMRRHIPENLTMENVYRQTSDSPSGHGGGFMIETEDLNMYVIKEIVFENVNLTSNEARVGGGGSLHVSKSFWNVEKRLSCFPPVYGVDSCQKLLFQNVNITDNKAEYAGGLFVTRPETVMLTCNRNIAGENRTLLEVMKSRFRAQNTSQNFKDGLLCTDIHDNQISDGAHVQGEDVGSAAVALHLENSNGTLKTVASRDNLSLPCTDAEGDPCPRKLTVAVKDAFNQTISRGTEDANLELTLSSMNVVGELRYTAKNGTADIVNTTAWGVNVSSAELWIRSSENGTEPIRVSFQTRACVLGESLQEHLCSPCSPGHYGFTPTNNSCTPCEDHAICHGRAALVPEDGYWHSTPFSPQFHPCFFPEACTYKDRAHELSQFYNDVERLQYLLDGLSVYIDGRGTMPNFSVYVQCADGYKGVLCGSCAANYGHSLNGQCSKCPSQRTVSIFLGVAFFLWIFSIVGTNAAMTLLSSRDRIRLVQSKLASEEGGRGELLKRTRAHANRNRVIEVSEQSRSISGPSSDMTDLHSRQLLQERLVATVQLTELLKILLNYLQITSAALRLHVDWNTEMEVLLSTEAALVGVASDELTAPFECLFDNTSLKHPSIAAIWLRMLIPTISLFVLVLVFSTVWLFIQRRHRKDQSMDGGNASVTKSWKTGVIVIVIVAVSFSFIDVIRDLFRTINCVYVDESVSSDSDNHYEKYAVEAEGVVWVEDTDLKCFKGKHLGTGIAGIFGLLVAFIVILSIVIRLPLNRRNMKNPKFIARYWFLYQGYRMEWFTFGWEAVILTRKALIAATIVFTIHLGPNLQAALCVGILLLALMIHSICRPFIVEDINKNIPDYFGVFFEHIRLPSLAPKWRELTNSTNLNGLESASLLCSMSVFLSAAIVHDSQSSRTGAILIGALTFTINLLYMMFMFYRLYAGLHLVCDLKLELSDPAYMALNANGPGICCLLKKVKRILKVIYEGHSEHLPSNRGNQYEFAVQCTVQESRRITNDPEITAE